MIDVEFVIAGAAVGFIVGLTGMGGGALMTPLLVLGFGVRPVTAVGSDLLASAVMKPVGGVVHARRGTVRKDLAFWLILGSVPSAFLVVVAAEQLLAHPGVARNLVATALDRPVEQRLDEIIEVAIGVALLLASLGLVAKGVFAKRAVGAEPGAWDVRPLPTLAIAVFGGIMVGLTSVGSGSLMMVLLLLLYPKMTTGQLVGTDLVGAAPLVAAASLAHVWKGEIDYWLTASLLIGALPTIYLGARISSKAPDYVIRPLLAVVLIATGVKLLGTPTPVVAVLGALLLTGYGVLQYRHWETNRRMTS